jgi:hypothetical protein
MTTADAVQHAYQWAFDTIAKNKSLAHMMAARELQRARDESASYDAAYERMVGLIREWKRTRRPGMEKPLELLTAMMGLGEDSLVESQA